MFRIIAGTLTASLVVIAAPVAAAAGDTSRGAKLFQQCAACHSTKPGEHLTGPSLAHAWGQRAASSKGFLRYSDALKRSDVTWNGKTLDQWLAGPDRFVPGNAMTFPGIRDPGARQDLIAYLKAVAENSAPTATGKQEGGMMMGRSQRANLKRAGADSQVLSASHCRDTYTIRTANGTVHKVWEYNLRLKTDSSGDGPQPGKPVIVGSGMMGDRMSLVFASPAEISGFIKASCSRGLDLHGKVSDPESAGGARAPRP